MLLICLECSLLAEFYIYFYACKRLFILIVYMRISYKIILGIVEKKLNIRSIFR